ncbi:hypothetical protein ACWEQ8_01220 [Streptomyces noursei]
MKNNTLMRFFTMLGPPAWRYAGPEAWAALEEEMGVALPADYECIIDGYGPVELNGPLSLGHPTTGRSNLAEQTRSTAQAWSGAPWEDVELESNQRLSPEILNIRFGTPDGLIHAVSENRSVVWAGQGDVSRGWWLPRLARQSR